MTTWRVELYDSAWGGFRNDDTAAHGLEGTFDDVRVIAHSEIEKRPHIKLRVVNEQTGIAHAVLDRHSHARAMRRSRGIPVQEPPNVV